MNQRQRNYMVKRVEQLQEQAERELFREARKRGLISGKRAFRVTYFPLEEMLEEFSPRLRKLKEEMLEVQYKYRILRDRTEKRFCRRAREEVPEFDARWKALRLECQRLIDRAMLGDNYEGFVELIEEFCKRHKLGGEE